VRIADADIDVPELLRTLGIEVIKVRGEWADALCPLHDERNPSFSIRLDTGRWICRHGDTKGSALGLVVRVKGVSAVEAQRYVQGLPVTDPGDEAVFAAIARINEASRGRDTDLPEWDAKFHSLDSRVMTEYWFERGFDERDARRFEVRYDPEGERVMWPIRDENANLLGYATRKLPGTFGKKYLYNKGFSRALYPLNHVAGDEAVLVEGPFDAMWLLKHRHNGLAMLGSGLTSSQLAWLFARVSRVTLFLDNDAVGVTALEADALAVGVRHSVRVRTGAPQGRTGMQRGRT